MQIVASSNINLVLPMCTLRINQEADCKNELMSRIINWLI